MKLVFRITYFVILSILFLPSVAGAISSDQVNTFNNGIYYFNTDIGTDSPTCGDDSTPTGSNPSGGSFSLDQVKAFAGEPITSTWNISDSTVEQWFLKQPRAQPVIARYSLNSGNIGSITSAVEAAKVSPVFFYLYTVNEGGAGGNNDGFINHTDRSGLSAVQAATADAQYLASESKITSDGPASGGGEPTDMPIAEAKAILDSLPLGSLGVAYIQATAAATAELESLSGKTGDWTDKYGDPFSDAMKNIQNMGGDPMQGGAGNCTGTVTGQGAAKAMNWAIMIAKNNGYGYDQDTRTSGWAKWQSDPSCTHQCGSFDCSSFMAAALTEAGYFKTNPEFTTDSEAGYLTQANFTNVTSSVSLDTDANMQPGDILLNTADHTAMYIGNGQIVAARINELGTATGGQVGDQTGTEIEIQPYYNYPWNSVWRASN